MVAFTKKLSSAPRSSIRRHGNRSKGIYHTVKRRSIPKNNTRKVNVMNNETRRRKKEKRRARLWARVVEEINDENIRENIGIYIDENDNLVSDEGEIETQQYDLLIEELQSRLKSSYDNYEIKILTKAIKFVTKERDAHLQSDEMNSLSAMMSGL